MNSAELREKYLAFFESKGCQRWPSSSLVPDDPSMLLTSAGMVQFKPWFLQQKQLDEAYIGTTTAQKCVRTTDIDVIGTDARHLSFFEMLGNFSFGAYFKEEMCSWALEFSLDVLGFDFERIYFTVFTDDDETFAIWQSLGVPESHISRLGEDDNFWRAGPTGPCGPCSELYYDLGEELGCGSPDCAPGCDCDRYIEFWNLVFTQYDSQEDGTLVPLPKKNIDTGMGLERTLVVVNGLKSVFESDVLRELIAYCEQLSGLAYGTNEQDDIAMRIIADHVRSCAFLVGDGVLPGNEGRSYVLRRLLRRAVRYGHLIGIEPPFLHKAVPLIVSKMGDVYPEVKENQTLIERVVLAEEERFMQTLRLGQTYLDEQLQLLSANDTLDGKVAFELHDRYGFPIDLTIEIATEQGVSVDRQTFDEYMEDQRQRARGAVKDEAWASVGGIFSDLAQQFGPTEFVGYDYSEIDAIVLAIIIEEGGSVFLVDQAEAHQDAQIILDRSPFYAEMGGQVGDTGSLAVNGTEAFIVSDTQTHEHIHAHIGRALARIKVGDQVHAAIDLKRRQRIERNHTATHLLHYALRQVVGDHVKQAGSLVAPDRLRFDFTHFEQLSTDQLDATETLANQLIMADSDVSASYTSLEEARAAGVIALFGEKYEDDVRVLSAGEESHELCGGTHVKHTAQIGFLKIVYEASVGSALRRIEAVTSYDALAQVMQTERQLRAASLALKARPDDLVERIEALQERVKELEVQKRAGRKEELAASVAGLMRDRLVNSPYATIVTRTDGLEAGEMRSLWDRIRDQLMLDSYNQGKAVLVIGGSTDEGSPLLIAAGTEAAVSAGFNANQLIKEIAPLIQGGGGGRPSMAQAGGSLASGLDEALQKAREILSI
ncbi:MAG: alanine--tRNA ligase [Coriobacteriia bacterium]|nr:alanine--tRNA ligase [Coriobacteriia bacterium]